MDTPKPRRAFHPFLFAAFPVLSLFSTNADRVVISELGLPLVLTVGGAALLWLALWPVFRHPGQRAIAVTAAVAAIYAYGPLVDALRRVFGTRIVEGVPALAVVVLVAGIAGAGALIALRRWHGEWSRATIFLNRTSLIAVAIPVLAIAWTLVPHAMRARQIEPNALRGTGAHDSANLPNIYYIILDAYARDDVLKDLYGYDNTPFLGELERRGFYVARESYANYGLTYLSLSSSLNMDYLDGIAKEHPSNSDFFMAVQDRCRRSKVAAMLKERGYTFVTFASGYTATSEMDADVTVKPPILFTEFENAVIRMTPLRMMLGRLAGPSPYAVHRNRILFTLDRLDRLARYGRPLFVFAHVEAPHPPFVFAADGSPVQTERPFEVTDGMRFNEAGGTEDEYIHGYVGQVTHVNRLVLDALDRIIAQDPGAIIVVQGDHGSRLKATNDLATTGLKETVAILNAYRLPGSNDSKPLYPAISPVNTFRVIFNRYFGEDYTLLPDRSFFCQWETPSNLVDVTDRLPHTPAAP